LQQKQEQALAICKRIEELGGELPMNWLDCELIYLERFAQKLQRILDRQVIGLSPPQPMHTKRAHSRVGTVTLLAVKSILLQATYCAWITRGRGPVTPKEKEISHGRVSWQPR
jgi:hypothetical protein